MRVGRGCLCWGAFAGVPDGGAFIGQVGQVGRVGRVGRRTRLVLAVVAGWGRPTCPICLTCPTCPIRYPPLSDKVPAPVR